MNRASQFIYRGRIVDLSLEEHRLPDGRSASFEIIRHSGGAAVLPVLDEGRIVLIRQYRAAVGQTLWEIPAGRLEPGEEAAACVLRELREEAGYRAGHLEKLGDLYPAVGYSDELIHLYLARDLVPVPRAPEPDEVIETFVLTIEDVRGMLRRGEIRDAKTQLALLLFLNA